MSETIKSNQPQDDQVAQAWADAMSTFTERTGLGMPKPQTQETSTWDDINWDDADSWDDMESWDDNTDFSSESINNDGVIIDNPNFHERANKRFVDEWGFDTPSSPTPYEQEKSRIENIKREAESTVAKRLKRIEQLRQENSRALDAYRNSGKYSDEQIDKISQYLEEYATDGTGSKKDNSLFLGILEPKTNDFIYGSDIIFDDPKLLEEYYNYQERLNHIRTNRPDDASSLENALIAYQNWHGMDSERLKSYQENVEPLVLTHDQEVSTFFSSGQNDSVMKDRFGARDYTVHCLVQEVTPTNVNELLMGRRELPTTDQHRLEQNRIDALELQGTLYKARDFIHDEFPGVHELLSAMLEYYDSRDDEELHQTKKEQLEEIVAERASNSGYYNVGGELSDYVFDLGNYEKSLHPLKLERNQSVSGSRELEQTEPAVDCLRRLVENTNPDRLSPPETKYPELNELMQKLRINQNEKTGETHVDWRQAGELVGAVNQILVDNQEKHGLYPSTVEAIAFTERIATFALRDITKRDWRELPYDPNFKEIVRFSQLTYSDKPYDARKFERFWNGFQDIPNGDLSDENLQTAYGKLQRLILANLSGLANKYSENPYTAERTKALWSGNLIRELVGLADPNATRK